MFDLVIKNGFIVDGTGSDGFVGDVAITGDTIAAVGTDLGPARRVLDATGLLVTPGWVDMHTHYDGQVSWDPYFTPSGWHGVTTVVMGNCGVGFAPVRAADREWVVDVMEGVEDIPGSALTEGIRWDWETFPEYLDALERIPHAIDFATQVPHSALRCWVMGQRGSEDDQATPEEVAQMKALVVEALQAGALGFSTSRTLLHKSASGVLVAGTHASREELFGIGEALREVGHGVFEIADEHIRLGADVHWLRELAQHIDRPVVFNLSQIDQSPELYQQLLGELDRAEADDVPLYAQCAGRAIGIMMGWRGTAHPFALHPTWLSIAQLPWVEQLAQLRDPAFRARLLADTPLEVGDFERFVTRSFDKMFQLGEGNDYEPAPEESLLARAAALGITPAELAYDLLMERDGEGMLYFPLFNYADGSLEPQHRMHSHPRTRMGLSDGGAHCGAICDAGMPTFMLTHWTRDRTRGERFSLPYMVMRQTRQTAAFYGLHDRGVLAPGMKADLNVIDYEGLRLGAPEMVWDLPANGRRLLQRATGYRYTLCSGQVIFADGEPTGALPGKLLRGEQPAPPPLATAG